MIDTDDVLRVLVMLFAGVVASMLFYANVRNRRMRERR